MLAEAYNMLKDVPARAAAAAAPAPPPPPPPPQIQLDNAPEARTVSNKTAEEWFKDAKAAADAKAPERALGLIQYAIRLDGEHAEYHALHAKVLDATKGDKRNLVRALETALRLNPKDVDSTILLAETFQALGMHARASRLWNVVHNLAPNHPIFSPVGATAGAKGKNNEKPGLGEQFTALVANAKEAIQRILNRG
jgi:tetratricopeptide (TPR) repeat protein